MRIKTIKLGLHMLELEVIMQLINDFIDQKKHKYGIIKRWKVFTKFHFATSEIILEQHSSGFALDLGHSTATHLFPRL